MARGHMIWFGMSIPKDVPFNRGGLPNGFLICSVEDMAHFSPPSSMTDVMGM